MRTKKEEEIIDEILQLLSEHGYEFNTLERMVQDKHEKTEWIESQIKKIRNGELTGEVTRTYKDGEIAEYLFKAYDPVNGQIVLTKKDQTYYGYGEVIDSAEFIFGSYAFSQDHRSA